MERFNTKSLWKAFAWFVVLEVIGGIGFASFEHIGYSESFYQTLYLLLTHFDHYGFRQTSSRVLVVILLLSSLVIIAYLLKWFADYMMGFNDNVKRQRMKAKATKLRQHYIICGLGRVGSQVMLELMGEGVEFVGVDKDKAKVDEAMAQGYTALQLDSTEDGALEQLGIADAAGLVACLGSDSENLIATLAAKALNPELYVVARANRKESETKLKRAGADRVALPYQIGGYHMATMVLRPNVVDYLDIVNSSSKNSELQVEEMVVADQSRLAGHRLDQILTQNLGATVIAINGADGTSHVRPTGKETIYPGDRLIILGAKRDLTEASNLIRG